MPLNLADLMLSTVAANLNVLNCTIPTVILFTTRLPSGQMRAEEPDIKIVRGRVTNWHRNHMETNCRRLVRVKHLADYFLIRQVAGHSGSESIQNLNVHKHSLPRTEAFWEMNLLYQYHFTLSCCVSGVEKQIFLYLVAGRQFRYLHLFYMHSIPKFVENQKLSCL